MDAQPTELALAQREAGRAAAAAALAPYGPDGSESFALAALLGVVRSIAPEGTNPHFRQGVLDGIRGWCPPYSRYAVAGVEGGG